jgi:ribA/ribD-fused uncharacterized protein
MNSVVNYVFSDSEKIFGFLYDFEFMSLTFPHKMKRRGVEFPSAGNAFHAEKCPDPKDFEKFSKIDPFKANEASVGVPVYKNWVDMRDGIMVDLMKQKFSDPELKKLLLSTGDKKLINANHWGDTYWGVNERGEGQNQLGLILEEVRKGLQEKPTISKLEEKVAPKIEETKKEKFKLFSKK